MKKRIARLFVITMIIISICGTYAYASYDYGNISLTCILDGNKVKKTAKVTAKTNGAQHANNSYKNYVNAYIRNKNNTALKSGFKYKKGGEAKVTLKDKSGNAKKANSYHAACDKNNVQLEDARKQIVLKQSFN